MDPIFYQLGPVTLHWYGVLFAGGFLAAAIHWSWLGRRIGMPPAFGIELCVWVILSSMIGARIGFVLANAPYFIEQPGQILRVDQGGMIFYGGLIGAALAVTALAKWRDIPFWRMADYAISAVPLGHAIGRAGCFMNGCCHGAVTEAWWAIPINKTMQHPVTILEATFNLALYIVLLQYYLRKHREGRTFALYLMIYPAGRFTLEFLRGDERLAGLFLNAAQELSLVLFVCGIVLWFAIPRKRHYHRPHANF